MTGSNNRRSAANGSESGLGVIQYFVVGGAGLAIAAIAVSDVQLPLPKISSEEFGAQFADPKDRELASLDRDYKPSGEAVSRVHQSEVALTYEGGPATAGAGLAGSDSAAVPTVIDTFAGQETNSSQSGPAGSIRLAEVPEVVETPKALQLAAHLDTAFDNALPVSGRTASLREDAPELVRSVPVPPSLAEGMPEIDLGVMELTADLELDESLQAAVEPLELNVALAAPEPAPEPALALAKSNVQAPAPALAAVSQPADMPVLVLTEEDMVKAGPNQALAELLERATPRRVTLAPGLSQFDLAKVDGTEATGSGSAPTALGQAIELQKPVQANGLALGNVDLRISGNSRIEVRLGSILSLLKDQMEPALYERLIAADSAGTYVTFADLRAAGIRINFDPVRDMLTMSTDAS